MLTHHNMNSLKKELKVAGIAILFGIFWFIALPVVSNKASLFEDSRLYRDVVGLTPFKDVEITSTRVFNEGTNWIEIEGSFVKVRCTKTDLDSAWTRGPDQVLHPATVNFSLEANETPSNRPPSGDRLYFGPWEIYSLISEPESAVLFVTHVCPEGPTTNMVFEVPWVTDPTPHIEDVNNTLQPYRESN